MIVRQVKETDLDEIKKILNIKNDSLTNAFKHCKETILLENNGIQAFILIREMAGMNEISHMHLKIGQELLLKSLKKKINGPISISVRESNKERIRLLEANNFRKISTQEGIYSDEKAIMMLKT